MNGIPCSTQLIFAEIQLEKAQAEIDTLRQRVAELEESEKSWIERGNYWTDEAAKMNAELTALKRSQQVAPEQEQGKPVAWMFKSPLGFKKLQENKPIFGANELPIGWSALYAAPQTCFSAADMADAAAKAAQVEREECARLCDSLTEGFAATTTWDSAVLNCSQHIRMRGKETK